MAKKSKPLLDFMKSDCPLTILRIITGVFFAGAGINKLANMSGAMYGLGVVELIIGVLLAVGLFTRLAAAVGVVIMLGALITVHFAGFNFNIYANGSERAFLYLAAFLTFLKLGAGKMSLEKTMLKKEVF